MPVYEYECTKCNHHIEIFQKISDKPITRCEKCNGKLKKLISQSSFHLKGSGWYATDYASKSRGYDVKSPSKDTGSKSDSGNESPKKEAKASDDKPGKGTSGEVGKKAKEKD